MNEFNATFGVGDVPQTQVEWTHLGYVGPIFLDWLFGRTICGSYSIINRSLVSYKKLELNFFGKSCCLF